MAGPEFYLIFILHCFLTVMLIQKSGVFLSSLVIVEHNLGIVGRVDLGPGHVLVLLDVGVHVDNFSVPFVTEEETGFPAS